jgi:hypothetical protein
LSASIRQRNRGRRPAVTDDWHEIGPLGGVADRPSGGTRMNGRSEQRRAMALDRLRLSILPDSCTHVDCECRACGAQSRNRRTVGFRLSVCEAQAQGRLFRRITRSCLDKGRKFRNDEQTDGKMQYNENRVGMPYFYREKLSPAAMQKPPEFGKRRQIITCVEMTVS